VDTNVLIYLLDVGSSLHGWAKDAFAERRELGPLIICDIVYSEFSVDLDSVAATDEALGELALERLNFSNEVLFRAGKAYQEHIKRGGSRANVLSDFLIAAQAEVHEAPLMTNNPRDIVSYFPKVVVICPPKS
jgi:hypothetical protein